MFALVKNSYCTCSHHQLQASIRKGANDEAKLLLKNLRDCCGAAKDAEKTLLHLAVSFGNTVMVQHLLNQRYKVNAQDRNGITPLMLAVREKKLAITEILLKYNANIYITDKNGVNSLRSAVECRNLSQSFAFLNQDTQLILEILFKIVNRDFLRDNRRIGQLLLKEDSLVTLAAVVFGSVKLTRFLLNNGYTIDFSEPKRSYTALHWAITFAKIQSAKLLIEHGAYKTEMSDDGNSPLFCYIKNCEAVDEKSELLKIILKCRINLNVELGNDLEYLLKRGNKETVRVVLQSGVHLTKDNFPLYLLVFNKDPKILDLLDELNIQYDINARNEYDPETALMIAANNSCLSKVEFLLNRGANPNLTSLGVSALYYAAMSNSSKNENNTARIIELLLENNADAQLISPLGSLPVLHKSFPHDVSIKIIIAHLAFLETLHESSLKHEILHDINTDSVLRSHFNSCIKTLKEMKSAQVYGSVTMFTLLSETGKNMLAYARNQEFLLTFENAIIKISEQYYCNILHRKMRKAVDKIKLNKKSAAVIGELIKMCSDTYHHIMYLIISYLPDHDLKTLCQVNDILFMTKY